MRPVTKSAWPLVNGVQKNYRPHQTAKPELETDLGCYCSYCEVYSSDLEVEHIISQHQDNTLTHNWDNFLLACGKCNGSGNKSNTPVNLSVTHFPHLNNTMLSFEYLEGGLVKVNPALTGASMAHAQTMLDLVKIDKYPGNAKYPRLNMNDNRWKHRRTAWEWAVRTLKDYEAGLLSAQHVSDFAIQRGFFSVWFTVFKAHTAVRNLLIGQYPGTATACFDAALAYGPVHRNPHMVADPI